MVMEALQTYAQLASGLTKTSREKATATAMALLSQAGLGDVAADAGDRVTKLADELIATSKANRQLLTKFVDAEVKKAVGKLGLAKAEDIESLRAEIAALRAANATATAAASAAASAATAPTSADTQEPEAAPATRRPAKKAPARKAPATEASAANVAPPTSSVISEPAKRPAKKASAAKRQAANGPAKKAAAKKTAAKSTGTKKAAAKKAATKETPAERVAAKRAGGAAGGADEAS